MFYLKNKAKFNLKDYLKFKIRYLGIFFLFIHFHRH